MSHTVKFKGIEYDWRSGEQRVDLAVSKLKILLWKLGLNYPPEAGQYIDFVNKWKERL